MPLIVDVGLALAILFGGQAMAAYRWPDHPRLRYFCGLGAFACGFGLMWVILFIVLGLSALEGVQKASIAAAMVLLVFAGFWPKIKVAVGSPPAMITPNIGPSVRFVSFVVGLKPVNGKTQVVVAVNFVNDGSDAVVGTFATLKDSVTPGTIPELKQAVDAVRALRVAELPGAIAQGAGHFYPIGPQEAQHTYVDGPILSPQELKDFQEGKVTYYVVGTIVARNKDGERQIPFCGYTVRGELSMCPVE